MLPIWRFSVKTDSSFLRLRDPGDPVRFRFEGSEIVAQRGESVAAALLAGGVTALRLTPVSGQPRAPFCMMGSCFDCLVLADGAEVQACMTEVTADMDVRRIDGVPEVTS